MHLGGEREKPLIPEPTRLKRPLGPTRQKNFPFRHYFLVAVARIGYFYEE
jgi:hypothetical protein